MWAGSSLPEVVTYKEKLKETTADFLLLFPFSSALRSLATRPSSARLSSFLRSVGWGVFTLLPSISRVSSLVTIKCVTLFLLLFRFLSAFVLFAAVIRFLFFPSLPFIAPLRFLSPVCGCFPFVFPSSPPHSWLLCSCGGVSLSV